MVRMKYSEQLKQPEWKRLRSSLLELNNNTCEECGSKQPPLHAHHIRYRKGARAWDYSLLELRCLCHTCHLMSHVADSDIRSGCLDLTLDRKREVLNFIENLETFMDEKQAKWAKFCESTPKSNFFSRMAEILGEDDE